MKFFLFAESKRGTDHGKEEFGAWAWLPGDGSNSWKGGEKYLLLFTFWKMQDRQPSLLVRVLKVFFLFFFRNQNLAFGRLSSSLQNIALKSEYFISWYIWYKTLWTRGPKGSKGKAQFEVAEYVLPKVSFLFNNLFQFVLKC